MDLKEPHSKRRKLQRKAHVVNARFPFTFIIPPMDARSRSGFDSSASSPPPPESVIGHIEGTVESSASSPPPSEASISVTGHIEGTVESFASSPPLSEASILVIGHIVGTEDADRTPTQSIFQTQLPPSPPGVPDLNEMRQDSHSINCSADDDHRKFFLEGIRNITSFAPQPFSLVSDPV